jgi:hypothetical protein
LLTAYLHSVSLEGMEPPVGTFRLYSAAQSMILDDLDEGDIKTDGSTLHLQLRLGVWDKEQCVVNDVLA